MFCNFGFRQVRQDLGHQLTKDKPLVSKEGGTFGYIDRTGAVDLSALTRG